MNRQQLIERFAQEQGISQQTAKFIIEGMFRMMTDTLVKGDRVEIRGFGSFRVKQYDGYTARKPKTGELIEVKSKKLPVFKVGKDLKKRVDT